MIRRTLPLLLTGFALALLVSTDTRAEGDSCALDCTTRVAACASEAHTALRACREGCRGQRKGCRRECRSAFGVARTTCREALSTCRDDCPSPGSDGFRCAIGCGGVGVDCLKRLLKDGKACVRTCRAAGNDLRTCLEECASGLGEGRDACKAAVRECRATCAPPSPTDPECIRECVGDARDCAEPLLSDLRDCTRDCRRDRGRVSLDCLRGCADDLCDCYDTLRDCSQACSSAEGAFVGVPPAEFCGSASAAFLD